uniref:U-box domain-containing protein n=1 Tax=Ananas comosus var. bracteatus TaxID=296719 RepID=A0A6V7PPZ6_ANACO|nr:unnamed protein product [Ananas comosus var. bracteatus]
MGGNKLGGNKPFGWELIGPVTVPSGITYDRRSIEAWLDMGNATCPVTNRDIGSEPELIPNHSLRRVIQDWCVANRSVYGIERIPTPKIPVTAAQVTEILSEIADVSGGARDESRASELAAKVKGLVGESERKPAVLREERRRAGACRGFVLWSSARPGPLEGILSALISMSPLDEETLQVIAVGSPSALRSVVEILKSGGLAARLNAALLINQLLVSSSRERAAEADGLVEGLFSLIKRPISAQATKAALVAAFRLVAYDKRTAARFAELGLVPLLLEALVDADRSFCEKALAVLDAVLSSPREGGVARPALTVPVLLKKMFRYRTWRRSSSSRRFTSSSRALMAKYKKEK